MIRPVYNCVKGVSDHADQANPCTLKFTVNLPIMCISLMTIIMDTQNESLQQRL